MNTASLRHALSLENIALVAEATKIPPMVLERIIDGNQSPTPEQFDLLAGFFRGEFSLCGTDFSWKRTRRPNTAYGTLPKPSVSSVPQREWSAWAAPPSLKPGSKPKGNGAPPNSDGFTGTGLKIR